MLYGLDLFTGVGGITLALQDYVTPLAYCEIDTYAQSVLLQRMQEGYLPKAPIWDDIRSLQVEELPRIDIIYGGSPCQDISVAGRQAGLEGERSGLIFEVFRLIDETKAPFIFLENVPNIRTKGAERICKELAERGYDCRWCNISARDVGALHKRERWFLLAYSTSLGYADKTGLQEKRTEQQATRIEQSSVLSNTECEGLHERYKHQARQVTGCSGELQSDWTAKSEFRGISNGLPEGLDSSIWEKEWEGVPRVIKGLPNRVDRIKALGNSVVPLQVREAFKMLIGLIN
jgi:DNA (cytosine-5)-methyltransferase 1